MVRHPKRQFLGPSLWHPRPLFVYFSFFSNSLQNKNVDFRGIRTRIVRGEGKHGEHQTTTTARYDSLFVNPFDRNYFPARKCSVQTKASIFVVLPIAFKCDFYAIKIFCFAVKLMRIVNNTLPRNCWYNIQTFFQFYNLLQKL